jgi:hypothetical protein
VTIWAGLTVLGVYIGHRFLSIYLCMLWSMYLMCPYKSCQVVRCIICWSKMNDFSTSVYKLNKEKNIMYFSKAIRIRATLYITMNQRSF